MTTLTSVKPETITQELQKVVQRSLGKLGLPKDIEIITSSSKKDGSLDFKVHVSNSTKVAKGGRGQEIAESKPALITARNRYLSNFKECGLKKSMLYSEVKFKGTLYFVIGLKGKSNRILVARKTQPDEIYDLDRENFLSNYHSVN